MPARATKENEAIKKLVAQGKRLGEIQSILTASGFKNVKPTRISYYLYKRDGSTVKTPKTETVATFNSKRLRSILDADFLTAEDKVMFVKKEIFPTGK